MLEHSQEILTSFQSLLPLLVVLLSRNELLRATAGLPFHELHDDDAKVPHGDPERHTQPFSYGILAIATVSAVAVLAIYSIFSTTALGTSSAIFTATGLVLLEGVIGNVEDGSMMGTYSAASSDSGWARRNSAELSQAQPLASLRDFAAALTATCGLSAILIEPSLAAVAAWEPSLKVFGSLQRICWIIPAKTSANALFYFVVSHAHGLAKRKPVLSSDPSVKADGSTNEFSKLSTSDTDTM